MIHRVLAVFFVLTSSAFAGDKALKEALKKSDSKAVTEACEELIKAGGKESLAPILSALPRAEGAIYWQLVSAAAGFKDEPALEELGRFIVARQNDKQSSSADLVFALGTNGATATTKALVHVLERGRLELQLMAADALAALRTKDGLAALEAALKSAKNDELRRRIESAVATGKGDAVEKPRDREFTQTRERGKESHVIVLSADRTGAGDDERDNDFDKIQRILERRSIAHRVVKKFEFEKDPKKYLDGCRALLVNCNRINEYCACFKCAESPKEGENANRLLAGCNPSCSVHKTACYKLSEKSLAAVKSWVEEKGGYLYTEDWGILDVIAPAWPEKACSGAPREKPRLVRLRSKDGKHWERHFDVKLRPVRGSVAHPFMRGVWQRVAAKEAEAPAGEGAKTTEKVVRPGHVFDHEWQIDDEAPAINVLDKAGVTVLLESEDLAKMAQGDGAVAITFRPGARSSATATGGAAAEWTRSKSGRVLHTISHFGHQDTSADGETLENLLLNFLLEASKQHEAGK